MAGGAPQMDMCVSVGMSVLTLVFIVCHVWWVGRIKNKQETWF